MKKAIYLIASLLLSGTLTAQSVTNGGFNGSTGHIGSGGVASPWVKGCAYNTLSDDNNNNPEIILDGANNVLELEGYYNPYPGGASFDLESAAQSIGSMPAGRYTVTFDARNRLQSTGNPGLLLYVQLKNYTGCSWMTTHPNPQQLHEQLSIPLIYNFNTYTATFCIPQSLDNELSILEFSAAQQNSSSTYCNGVIDIDNVSIAYTPQQYDLAYDYQIDCLTGLLKVKPNSTLDPSLYDMFIVMENNSNDPNNQSDQGDTQHDAIAWWNYSVDNLGWYTVPLALVQGKNYYLKRGIWGDCLNWVELRKFNIELQPDQFDTSFDIDISCNSLLQPILSVTGANQQGKNPHHLFDLYKHFPGTNTPDQWVESIAWWQQSNANNYQYQEGPFSFNHELDPNSHYYVKRGVWDACTPWAETKRYDINPVICDPNEVCDIYITPLLPPCFDGCGGGKSLSEFQINPNSTCYSVIDYVVFQTINNQPFGPTFTDVSAPYVVPYCTSGNYYVTATIHYLNGTTSTASYFQPSCGKVIGIEIFKSLINDEEVMTDEINLYPNPVNEELHIETNLDYDEILLYSIGGKLIGSYSDPLIQVSNLESGYYLLKFVKDGNVRTTERFVKQ